jgi:hypothetical protein
MLRDSVAPTTGISASMFPTALRREILILLAAKLAALTAIYFVFFAPAEFKPDTRAIQAHLLFAGQDGDHGHR